MDGASCIPGHRRTSRMDGMNTSQVQQVQKREARSKGMENGDRKDVPSTVPITGTMDRTRFSQLSSSIHFWAHKPALSWLLDSCNISSSSQCHLSLGTNVPLRKSPCSYKPRSHLLFHDGSGREAQGLVSQGSCSVSQGRLLLQRTKFNKHAISREVISDANVPVRAIT